jgi:CobQ-like glutamine amidotransferase family enzyme
MNSTNLKPNTYNLTIGWLYPDLMSTYGDRGNIIVLQKRCEWRGIEVKIERISIETSKTKLEGCDLLFMGGAQDTQQEIVNKDLFENKGKILKEKINNRIPGLYVCGAYQFLGKYYKTAEGKRLPGLEIFPIHTENPGETTQRLIGNIIVKTENATIIGFENHGGRTYLEDKILAFGKIQKGFGNNGEDGTEGILFKNSIGTYFHGPILPKNPEIADFLIQKAIEMKYGEKVELEPLDDSLGKKAKDEIAKRIMRSV